MIGRATEPPMLTRPPVALGALAGSGARRARGQIGGFAEENLPQVGLQQERVRHAQALEQLDDVAVLQHAARVRDRAVRPMPQRLSSATTNLVNVVSRVAAVLKNPSSAPSTARRASAAPRALARPRVGENRSGPSTECRRRCVGLRKPLRRKRRQAPRRRAAAADRCRRRDPRRGSCSRAARRKTRRWGR